MATVKFYHDTRGLKKSQEAPLKIKVTSHGIGSYINIGIKILPSQWNEKRLRIINHPQEDSLNIYIQKKILEVEETVRGLNPNMNGKQMVDAIKRKSEEESGEYKSGNTFIEVMERFRDIKATEGTKTYYSLTIGKIRDFDKKIGIKVFEDIDVTWLEKFQTWMIDNGLSQNTRHTHLQHIRAVFNYARKDLDITTTYPFYKFRIAPFTETRKRSLSLEQMQELAHRDRWSRASKMSEYIDIFLLSFYLRGIRPVDLFMLKKTDLHDGRIEYIAHKSTQARPLHYSVKVEPEAMEIINRYKGKGEYLLNCTEGVKKYAHALVRFNHGLKDVFPGLSMYWARHTWASIAVYLDIPIETVSAGLGHLHGLPTTLVYVAFNQKKVDEANRMVIDAVLNIRR